MERNGSWRMESLSMRLPSDSLSQLVCYLSLKMNISEISWIFLFHDILLSLNEGMLSNLRFQLKIGKVDPEEKTRCFDFSLILQTKAIRTRQSTCCLQGCKSFKCPLRASNSTDSICRCSKYSRYSSHLIMETENSTGLAACSLIWHMLSTNIFRAFY